MMDCPASLSSGLHIPVQRTFIPETDRTASAILPTTVDPKSTMPWAQAARAGLWQRQTGLAGHSLARSYDPLALTVE